MAARTMRISRYNSGFIRAKITPSTEGVTDNKRFPTTFLRNQPFLRLCAAFGTRTVLASLAQAEYSDQLRIS